MNTLEGTYRPRDLLDDDYFDKEIVVLGRAPDGHNGPGVHWHTVGDTTGYGWMSLKYLAEAYIKTTLKA